MSFPVIARAAPQTEKNPVVDISGLMRPGQWEATVESVFNGKTQKPRKTAYCITAGDTHDFLNRAGAPQTGKVEAYKLDGNRLHVKAVGNAGENNPMELQEDIVFDGLDAQHGVTKITVRGEHPLAISSKMQAHRTGACKKKPDAVE